jgi:hypothetical protein
MQIKWSKYTIFGTHQVAYVDGSSANRNSGVGVTLTSPEGEKF